MTDMLNIGEFYELSYYEMESVDGGINWGDVAKSAAISAVIGAVGSGIAGAGCGTVALPIVGTVTVGVVCAVGGFVGGAVVGATKSILTQIFK